MKIRVDDHMFQKDGKRKTHLMIFLDAGEPICDPVLRMICEGECIHFHKMGDPATTFLRIECSAEELGRLNPKSIWFGGCIENLEDSLFQYCTQLEDIWLGGSKVPILNQRCENLMRLPIRHIGMNGYGAVVKGEGLTELVKYIHENGGEVEEMIG